MSLFSFEHYTQPIAPISVFLRRWFSNFAIVVMAIFGWLCIGAIAYHCIDDREWADAFHSAAMTVSGMGSNPQLTAGKFFFSFYAAISPLLIGVGIGWTLAHPFHRVLHHLFVGDGESATKIQKSSFSKPPSD